MQSLNATKYSKCSTILPVTQEFVDNIVSSTDEIIKEKDPKNLLKATSKMISILEVSDAVKLSTIPIYFDVDISPPKL